MKQKLGLNKNPTTADEKKHLKTTDEDETAPQHASQKAFSLYGLSLGLSNSYCRVRGLVRLGWRVGEWLSSPVRRA